MVEPDVAGINAISQGRVRQFADPVALASRWRAIAEAKQLSIRELIIEVTGALGFVGTPHSVADKINRNVQEDAADGYILIPHLTPHGLDEFVDRVVPMLQEMGVLRAEYQGRTLRDHLGLALPSAAL